jgi:hypothetical protein
MEPKSAEGIMTLAAHNDEPNKLNKRLTERPIARIDDTTNADGI